MDIQKWNNVTVNVKQAIDNYKKAVEEVVKSEDKNMLTDFTVLEEARNEIRRLGVYIGFKYAAEMLKGVIKGSKSSKHPPLDPFYNSAYQEARLKRRTDAEDFLKTLRKSQLNLVTTELATQGLMTR